MKLSIVILFAAICVIALLPVAIATDTKADFEVSLAESAFARCQNGIREPSESCDLGTKTIKAGEDLCPAIGKILKIVQVCRSEACACLSDRMDCGNGIREGAEWCDPGDEAKEPVEKNDLCPKLSELLNRSMACNKDTCLCKATTDITANVTCGDGQIGFREECEQDSDCDEGKECSNSCKCITKLEINQSELAEKLSQSDIPAPEKAKEDAVEMKEKKEFDYHDLAGKTVPDLFYSDFEDAYTNVNVEKGENSYIVGVRTEHNVVQEILDNGYEEPEVVVFVSEEDAKAIIGSENRLDALDAAVGEGRVAYRPAGIFGRMWFWLKGMFR
jgi:hypothetical protein